MQRIQLLVIPVLVLAMAACSSSATPTPTLSPNADLHPTLGEPFVMRIGNSAFIDANGYRIDFVSVPSDSRCPKDAQCMQPDVALIGLKVRESATADAVSHNVFFDSSPSTETVGAYTIQVLGLQPRIEDVTDSANYVVTLLVTKPVDAPTLNPQVSYSASSAHPGDEVTFTAKSDGSGLTQYTLLANNVVIGILRYDGTLARGSQAPAIELAKWSADANQASWTIKSQDASDLTMTVEVSGKAKADSGGDAFISGSATMHLSIQ